MLSAVAEPPVSAPILKRGGPIKARTDIDWEQCKAWKIEGLSFIEIGKRLNVPSPTIASGFARRGWIRGGLEPKKRDNLSPSRANFAPAEIEKRKKDYVDAVAYLVVEDGVKQLLKEKPRNGFAIRDMFKTVNEIHSVAKDIFGIGKDASGPQTIVNIGLLADPSKGAKMAINVQSGQTISAPVEVPSEVVLGSSSSP